MHDIAVIIVSWNVRERLRTCLDSVQKAQKNLKMEIFVVDNASRDGSAQMVETEFSHVKLIKNTYNAGCSRAVNAAIKRSTANMILWLNPDMELYEDALITLVETAQKNPQAGVIGARLETKDGAIVPHVRKFPTWFDQLMIITKITKIFPSTLNTYLCKNFDYDAPAEVDSIRGSFFAMPKSAMEKIGLLDENFFVWFEEVDYCKRAIRAGYTVLYEPSIKAVDYVGQSFAQVPTITKQKMWIRSLITYAKKHGL